MRQGAPPRRSLRGQGAAPFVRWREWTARAKRPRRWRCGGWRTGRRRAGGSGRSPTPEGGAMSELLLDAAGRRRSPATLPEFHAGRPPRNEGMRYPADPPTIEEIVTVMRRAGDGIHGRRPRGLIVVLWRAGLRICEALALAEADLDPRRGSLLVRRGEGGRRREVGMDDWAWEQLAPWLDVRVELPVGPLFCVVNGATRGRPWAAAAARTEPRRVAREAGVRRRFAPHQLRHAHAVE